MSTYQMRYYIKYVSNKPDGYTVSYWQRYAISINEEEKDLVVENQWLMQSILCKTHSGNAIYGLSVLPYVLNNDPGIITATLKEHCSFASDYIPTGDNHDNI